LLAILWLWTLLRQRQRPASAQPPAHGLTYRPVEAEDVLKAAYLLQEREGAWNSLGAASLATVILNKTVFRGEPGGFVLEMPPYRKPKWGQVAWRALVDRVAHTMWRAIEFAGPASLLIWLLGNLPPGAPFEQTAVGWLVRTLAPLGRPFGLTGEILAALLFTLPAKEIVVPALAMTYGLQTTLVESERVLSYLPQVWTPLSSYTFVVFFMLYLPCLVTVWATWKETRSLKWTLMGLLVPLTMASAITFLVCQGGRLLGF
jgi:ferrous iron transport protein B